jgi:hypothetical protein
MSKQPRDEANYPIPLLSYKLNGGQTIPINGAAALSNAIGNSTRVVSLYSTVDCFFEVGDSTVTANLSNSHFLPTGIYIDVSMGSDNNSALNYKYISAICTSSGYLYLSERI